MNESLVRIAVASCTVGAAQAEARRCMNGELCNRIDCESGEFGCRGRRLEGDHWPEMIQLSSAADLRRLAELPPDVRIVAIGGELPWNTHRAAHQYPDEWIYKPRPPAPPDESVFVRIEHRYCCRTPEGGVLVCTPLDSFLARYKDLTKLGR